MNDGGQRFVSLVTAAVDEHWGACDLVEGAGFVSCDTHDTVVAYPDQPRPAQTAHCWYYQRVEDAAKAAVASVLTDLRQQVEELPTTRTPAWPTGWYSVGKRPVLDLLGDEVRDE